jgi:hypothetical protein
MAGRQHGAAGLRMPGDVSGEQSLERFHAPAPTSTTTRADPSAGLASTSPLGLPEQRRRPVEPLPHAERERPGPLTFSNTSPAPRRPIPCDSAIQPR